jgi:hypothetical protein
MPTGKYQLEVQRLGRTDYTRVILSSVLRISDGCEQFTNRGAKLKPPHRSTVRHMTKRPQRDCTQVLTSVQYVVARLTIDELDRITELEREGKLTAEELTFVYASARLGQL